MPEPCKSCGAVCPDTPAVARHIINAGPGSHTAFAVEWARRYLKREGGPPPETREVRVTRTMAWYYNAICARLDKKVGKAVFELHAREAYRELLEQ